MKTTLPISCNKDCGSGCPLTAHIENGRLVKVTDNPLKGKYMQGCAKGYRMPEILYHPDRLKKPLIRVGERGTGSFREAEWGEALTLAASKLSEAKSTYGPESILNIGGSGSCRGALHNTARLLTRFLALFGGYTETRGSYSSEAVSFVNPFLFGTNDVGIDVRTLLDSELVILWGFNPADTRFGCETEAVLRELKKRGTPVIVIDPRRTASVDLCGAEWIPIYPGSDNALAAALLRLLILDDRIDLAQINLYSIGFSELTRYVCGDIDGQLKDPAWAEEQCGISEAQLLRLYKKFISAQPAAVLPGLSIQRTLGGEDTNRFLTALQLAAGNIGKSGGSTGSGQWNHIQTPRCGKIEVPGNPAGSKFSIPVYEWADAVLKGKEGGYPSDISVLYNVGGNFAVQSSDSTKVRKALQRVDFIISHDFFLTPTCEWSDIVFPVKMFPERTDICFSNSGMLLYSPKVVETEGQAKDDFEILCLLADSLGFGETFSGNKTSEEWIESFIAESEIDDPELFRKRGIWEGEGRMSFGLSDFIDDPVKNALSTPSGKIELVSDTYLLAGGAEVPHLGKEILSEQYPLFLITPHEKFRIHSQNTNVKSLAVLLDDRLEIHAEDAEDRFIGENDVVRVQSSTGSVIVNVKLSYAIAKGVVSLKSGFWYTEKESEVAVYYGTNTLTNSDPTFPSHGSRTHSNAVQVLKIL
ncbi:MAG: molybdopterin-dependent oxidoreductase [Bacteroidetes bacterium]|nr:molybdopterin-dependent oxidoreductase [Bacteroidota bacterium]